MAKTHLEFKIIFSLNVPLSVLDPGSGAQTTRIAIPALLAGWPAPYHTYQSVPVVLQQVIIHHSCKHNVNSVYPLPYFSLQKSSQLPVDSLRV
jgi:hypothetical protein